MKPGYFYFAARLPIGLSLLGHGLVRFPKLDQFSQGMVKSFENSFLPQILVEPFAYALPILEFVIGLFIIIGLFTRQSLFSGLLVMSALVFGSTAIESWDSITSQLVHSIYLALLLYGIGYNDISLDRLFSKKGSDYA